MMKLFAITLLMLMHIQVYAQLQVISYSSPAGYTTQQYRQAKSIEVDAQNNLWVTFAGIGLGKFDLSAWTMYNTSNSGLPSDTLSALEFDSNGNLWIGSSMGLVKYDGSNWTVFNTQNSGLPNDSITCIKSAGTMLYIGTWSGFSVYDGVSFMNFSTSNGLLNDSVNVIEADGAGMVYVGSNDGISVYDGSLWTHHTSLNSSMADRAVFDICRSGNGRVWFLNRIGLLGARLYYIDLDGSVKNFCDDMYQEVFDCSDGYLRLTSDASGNVVFGSSGSKIYLLNDSYIEYLSDGYFNGRNPDVVIDGYGNLWVCGGVFNGNTPFLKRISFSGYQPPYGIPTTLNTKKLNINQVDAVILNRGDMHWDLNNPGYEVPSNSGKNSVFTSALWIGGLDSGGNLHLASQNYRQTGVDYWPGPISGVNMPFDSTLSRAFDRVWNIYKYQVVDFIANFQNGSVTNGTYPVPAEFLTWPAKGNYNVTSDKAPYVDYNNDGSYDPFDGDYPLIKGDQMLFWIFNDSLADHTNSDGMNMGVEVLASAYAYNCSGAVDSLSVINYTTFYNYRIINQSAMDYDSVYVGFWSDMDLGNYGDDYIGCDSSRATGFTYNGDNDDEGATGYGLNPPMQNIRILNGTLADPMDGTDNDLDGITDEPGEKTTMNHFMSYDGVNGSPTGQPATAIQYYYLMQSRYVDGTHLTYLGIPGGVPTNFLFSGAPYDSGWAEPSNGNTPADRRFIMSSGPVSLDAGNELNFDIAYIFTRDSLNPNGFTTSIARNIADLDRVKYWFDTDSFPSCEVYTVGVGENSIQSPNVLYLYPNPSNEYLSLYCEGECTGANVEIIDYSGRILYSGIYKSEVIDVRFLPPGLYFVRLVSPEYFGVSKFVRK